MAAVLAKLREALLLLLPSQPDPVCFGDDAFLLWYFYEGCANVMHECGRPLSASDQTSCLSVLQRGCCEFRMLPEHVEAVCGLMRVYGMHPFCSVLSVHDTAVAVLESVAARTQHEELFARSLAEDAAPYVFVPV